MVKKMPAIQLYTGDWLKDPHLSMCSPATRGIWIDLLCAMHENSRCGTVSGTMDQLARLCRCTTPEMRAAVEELKNTQTASVTVRHKKITVENRRMAREHKSREQSALRQRRFRRNAESNEDVPTHSSISVSTSYINTNSNGVASDPIQSIFQAWRDTLPDPSRIRLTPARKKKIRTRLNEGWSVEDLCAAVAAWKLDDWPDRPKYNDLKVLLNSEESTERWVRLARSKGNERRNIDMSKSRFLDE